MSPASMERNRAYNRNRRAAGLRESSELRRKHNRKYRVTSYGLTMEGFDRLLEAQGYACGMCREPFGEGQLIHVDHDHSCCRAKNRSCGKCVRGLLCHGCNIALGHIERRYATARAYLDDPPVKWAAGHDKAPQPVAEALVVKGGQARSSSFPA